MLPDEIFTFAISIICPSPQKSSAARKVYRADRPSSGSPIGRGFRPRAGGMCSFVFLFVEKCVILVLRPYPPTSIGGEVSFMVHFLAILESVVADVISHYICKWLDRFDKDRKPD